MDNERLIAEILSKLHGRPATIEEVDGVFNVNIAPLGYQAKSYSLGRDQLIRIASAARGYYDIDCHLLDLLCSQV